MKSVYWTPEATQDRDDIYDWIEADSPAAAADLDELFEKKAAPLATHSALGRSGRVPGTRELVIHPNYILIYDVAGEEVRVLRVLHARRQWPHDR
ncbi:MAG: type II toxin-antitoxin system RelE/ParE family toxin [Novosphingobium sp.]|jgi:addiction module RelE/StbE family toxin|nr:type II toxin-antitoxin system RelE/ParE family toxin [Novosphingobium sp.]